MKRQSYPLLSVFVLLALLLQGMIPVGFMPSFGNDGQITMVICSGDTIKTITIDTTDAEGHAQNDEGNDHCPYAPVNTASHVDGNFIPFVLVIAGHHLLQNLNDIAFDVDTRLHAPRAPPVLS